MSSQFSTMKNVVSAVVIASIAGALGSHASRADTPTRDPAAVDVCALLSTADAESAADVVRRADGRGTGTRYSIERTKQSAAIVGPTAYCTFALKQTDADGYGGVIGLGVSSAGDFPLYKRPGEPVDGIGDEAVHVAGSTVARVGDLMLAVGESSLDRRLTDEIVRKVAERLKQDR